jgi:hypothetical protein
MNDLTFGTTLLASFAALLAAVLIESLSPVPPPHAAVAFAASQPAPERVAQAGSAGCPRVALAPVSIR